MDLLDITVTSAVTGEHDHRRPLPARRHTDIPAEPPMELIMIRREALDGELR